jgi:O-antigen/teichoic acid export membrane protein
VSDYFRKTFSVLITNFAMVPLNIIAGIIIARYLGAEGKGILALVILIATILKLIGGVGIEYANVYFISKNRSKVDQIFTNSIFVWIIASAVLALIIFLLKELVLNTILPGFDRNVFNLTMAVYPFFLWWGFALAIFQGMENFREFNLLKLLVPIIKFGAVVLFVVILQTGIIGGTVSIILSYAIPAVFSIILLSKYTKPKLPLDKALLCNGLSYGLKGQVGLFFQFFNYRLDMFLVNIFMNIQAVGYYSISVAIAELLWYIPNSITLTLFPRTSAKNEKSATLFTCKVCRKSVALMIITSLAVGILGKILIPILYGDAFAAAVNPLLILLPGVVAYGLVKILIGYLQGQGKPQYGSYVTIISLALTIIFDYLLIPTMGIVGAALATTIAYVTSFGLTSLLFIKVSSARVADYLMPDFTVVHEYLYKIYDKQRKK